MNKLEMKSISNEEQYEFRSLEKEHRREASSTRSHKGQTRERINSISFKLNDQVVVERPSTPYENPEDEEEEIDWCNLSRKQKIRFVVYSILKFLLFVLLLYLFLLSLSFMSIGFTMVTSYALQAGDVIRFILANPFAALAIGIIATAIVQNATATTSIAVIMVGAGIIPDVKSSVPIIMGANIGTCVTNSFIALTLAGDPNEFKRAFSAATLNDGFNILSAIVMLPIEIFTDFLYLIAEAITDAMPFSNAEQIAKADFINLILIPVTDVFIQLNTTAVDLVSGGDKNIKNVALRCCQTHTHVVVYKNETDGIIDTFNSTVCIKQCTYWCMPMLKAFGDGGTGLFWIILSTIVLIASLFGIVKVLSLFIVGPIAEGVRKALNFNLPGKFKWIAQLVLFVVAFLLTLIVQSSNIITATLVPLCGIGIISLQRVYVMTLGSNIGTTVTGILTAFTQPPSSLKRALQLAFVYTLFNSLGVILWLPIRFLRFPKKYARGLGNIVFEYRWFLYVYVSMVYFIIPLIIFGLALVPKWIGLAVVGIPVIVLFVLFIIVRILQTKFPHILPEFLKSFEFLPTWLRSLKPYDELLKKRKRLSDKIVCTDITNMESTMVDTDHLPIPNIIRRLSAIDSVIREAKRHSLKNSIGANDSSSEEEHDTEAIKEYRRRKSISNRSMQSHMSKSRYVTNSHQLNQNA
jgi:sodium-dependent phosphate cotransporter